MFRNALRQSTRAVSAISASGRVAAVRFNLDSPMSSQFYLRVCAIDIRAIYKHLQSSIEAFYVVSRVIEEFEELAELVELYT